MTIDELRATASRIPSVPLASRPSPVLPMTRLSNAIGGGPRLLVKRDDVLDFAFGGNKVRKLALLAAAARAYGPKDRGSGASARGATADAGRAPSGPHDDATRPRPSATRK
jgi:hypothetical protein